MLENYLPILVFLAIATVLEGLVPTGWQEDGEEQGPEDEVTAKHID